MRVTKVFNNNAVMANDPSKGDYILLGSGIGFYVKKGDLVDESKIEKVFIANENTLLFDLLNQIPSSYLNITDEIVRFAKSKGINLSDSIYLALTDHLYFAIDRISKGIDLDNPYLVDIQHFYPREYQVGVFAGEIIRRDLAVEIPDYEKGYITMHLIENSDSSGDNFKREIEIIDVAVAYFKDTYLKDVSENSLAYSRLITHVKFFARRYVNRDPEKQKDEKLDAVIRKTFAEEYAVVQGLNRILKEKYGFPISEAEKNYLVLHIRNCQAAD